VQQVHLAEMVEQELLVQVGRLEEQAPQVQVGLRDEQVLQVQGVPLELVFQVQRVQQAEQEQQVGQEQLVLLEIPVQQVLQAELEQLELEAQMVKLVQLVLVKLEQLAGLVLLDKLVLEVELVRPAELVQLVFRVLLEQQVVLEPQDLLVPQGHPVESTNVFTTTADASKNALTLGTVITALALMVMKLNQSHQIYVISLHVTAPSLTWCSLLMALDQFVTTIQKTVPMTTGN